MRGLCLIDPVDSSSMAPTGPGYPSALPALTKAATTRAATANSKDATSSSSSSSSVPACLPAVIIGAGQNGDVVEPQANWQRFTRAAIAGGAAVWEVVVSGAGHLQFLDKQMGLFAMFSASGSTPDAVVRSITQVTTAKMVCVCLLKYVSL